MVSKLQLRSPENKVSLIIRQFRWCLSWCSRESGALSPGPASPAGRVSFRSIAGKPVWWVLVMFVPLVNLNVPIAVAENFGKGARCGLGLAFVGFIFYPILGFGDAQYRGVKPA